MNDDQEIARPVVPEIMARGNQPPHSETPGTESSPAIRFLAAVSHPRIAIPLLLAVGALLYLVNLGGYPLYTKGEPREAVTVFDIVHGGGIILPMRAGVELPSKPLLMHWVAAIFSLAAGAVTAFTVRLPSAIFAIAGMLACYGYVRRLYDSTIALLAALILGTTVQYLQAGTGSRVDMTLTFFLTLAFFEFIMIAEGLTRRWIGLYLAIAFAVLAKGPVGLVLPGLVALVWMTIERRWDLLRSLRLVRGAIIVAIIGGGWYAAAIYIGGMSFVRKQLLGENLVRFVGGANFHQGHAHPFIYVELALIMGFLPWTILLAVAAIQSIRRPLATTPRLTYLVTWFIAVLIFYNLATSKRGVYLLAVYPALATILAIYLKAALCHPDGSQSFTTFAGWTAGGALVSAGALAIVSLAVLAIAPGEMRYFMAFWGISAPGFVPALQAAVRERWFSAMMIPLAVEVLGFYLWRKPDSLARLIGATAAATGCIALAANLVVVPAIANTLSLRGFTMQIINTIGHERVGYLGALDYDIAFYSGMNIPIVHGSDPDLPNYLICWSSMYRSMPERLRQSYVIAIKSNPTTLDGTDVIVLLRRATLAPAPGSNAVEVRWNSYRAQPTSDARAAGSSAIRSSAIYPTAPIRFATRSAAWPCRNTPSASASNGSILAAISAPTIPESASPIPGVAIPGLPLELTVTLPLASATTERAPFSSTLAPVSLASFVATPIRFVLISAALEPSSRAISPGCGVSTIGPAAPAAFAGPSAARAFNPSASISIGRVGDAPSRSNHVRRSLVSSFIPAPGPKTIALLPAIRCASVADAAMPAKCPSRSAIASVINSACAPATIA